MIRIVLVDDEATVRQGLRMLLQLEPDLDVVGEADNGAQAVALVQAVRPDVVVMDVEMPEMDGIAATSRLCQTVQSVAVVMLSIHGDVLTRGLAQAAGAAAFVEKQGSLEMLLDAIRQAYHTGHAAVA